MLICIVAFKTLMGLRISKYYLGVYDAKVKKTLLLYVFIYFVENST